MLTEERQKYILEQLSHQKIIKTQTLVTKLDASESTIRRDLQEMEAAGLLKRIHGGAKQLMKLDTEPDMLEKSSKNLHEKQIIAKYASDLVKNGDFIYLDAGTSTYEMIPFLKGKEIHVITNSVYHANALVNLSIPTMIIGGTIRLKTKAVINAFSVQQLELLRFDKAFLGINGVDANAGLTTPDPDEAIMKSTAIQQSEQLIVLADASKFNKVSFAKVAEIDAGLILTNSLPEEDHAIYTQLTTIKELVL
ncbi:DeoR/GlpR family DNA-binding transcription regulator [Vagococcus intermedius]|uniref:DeoR/GlpR family DNA-binding transcription regulator n=1 Tax=Vagococcus intermedius TaxID=2991418 RepID=A0AAF0I585_9ENTE|nr:DeoR/GlpR family DNA-binding transcription regulator [Vagococcus intermedius]WEG72823.1 DeoR/GlpR family DNA-binding transcription regulator [Vagococcus intermedius]WEG74909.1 DeoR/GlpR family DNA-binding transcription regulator [Vagococcus intermedius]